MTNNPVHKRTLRSPERKKAYRAALKAQTKEGLINDASGKMVPRRSLLQTSMTRDYSPQGA